MSELSVEEKEAIKNLRFYSTNVGFSKYDGTTCVLRAKDVQIVLNLIGKQYAELNSLKEIEQQHKTDNGLLRQELDMQIEHNKELEDKQIWNKGRIEELKKELVQEKEENKELEEKLKISVAILTKGTYPEENEGDNDFDKQFIAVDKIKELLENEIIDISGFRCIAVEDIENLLEV